MAEGRSDEHGNVKSTSMHEACYLGLEGSPPFLTGCNLSATHRILELTHFTVRYDLHSHLPSFSPPLQFTTTSSYGVNTFFGLASIVGFRDLSVVPVLLVFGFVLFP